MPPGSLKGWSIFWMVQCFGFGIVNLCEEPSQWLAPCISIGFGIAVIGLLIGSRICGTILLLGWVAAIAFLIGSIITREANLTTPFFVALVAYFIYQLIKWLRSNNGAKETKVDFPP